MKNWHQNYVKFIYNLRFIKVLRIIGGKIWKKTHGFYLHVNCMKRREFLFTALLQGPSAWHNEGTTALE